MVLSRSSKILFFEPCYDGVVDVRQCVEGILAAAEWMVDLLGAFSTSSSLRRAGLFFRWDFISRQSFLSRTISIKTRSIGLNPYSYGLPPPLCYQAERKHLRHGKEIPRNHRILLVRQDDSS